MGIRDRFAIDVERGDDMKAHGNVLDHEYEIERGGDTVATISKKWFRVRESYGVDIAAGEDASLILAITRTVATVSPPRSMTILSRMLVARDFPGPVALALAGAAVVLGVTAAIIPARRAARLKVITALTYE